MPDSLVAYEKAVESARTQFERRLDAASRRSGPTTSAVFLMYVCAQGVGMTCDVSSWNRLAGDAAKRIGDDEVNKILQRLALATAEHPKLLAQDTLSLVAWWNGRFANPIDAAVITQIPELHAVGAYRQLHLNLIATAPYARLAIAYEIERLTNGEGAKLCRRVIGQLDLDVVRCLSFFMNQLRPGDSGKQCEPALRALLATHPEHLPVAASYAARALSNYAGYVEGCLDLAERTVKDLGLANTRRLERPFGTKLKGHLQAISFLAKTLVQARGSKQRTDVA